MQGVYFNKHFFDYKHPPSGDHRVKTVFAVIKSKQADVQSGSFIVEFSQQNFTSNQVGKNVIPSHLFNIRGNFDVVSLFSRIQP